jgi:hypothetical protein
MVILTVTENHEECTYLAKLHPTKRDKLITFDEKPHKYAIRGDETNIKSCTEFIHLFFTAFDAQKISQTCAESQTNPEYIGKAADEIQRIWELGSALGSEMHYQIERNLNGLPYTLPEFAECPEIEMYVSFCMDNPHLRIWRTEMRIFDEEYRIAGSIDAIYEDLEKPGYFYIVDWKRANKIWFEGFCECRSIDGKRRHGMGRDKLPTVCTRFAPHPATADLDDCNFNHYSLQLMLYRYILEKNYKMKFTGQCLVVLHPHQRNYLKIEGRQLPGTLAKMLEYRKEMLKGLDWNLS